MVYDFSLLPDTSPKRNILPMVLSVGVFLSFLAAIKYSDHAGLALTLTIIATMLVVSGIAIYMLLGQYRDRKAFERFISKHAQGVCSEDQLWALLPPCFKTLADHPDLAYAAVYDGYNFSVEGTLCTVFLFEYALKEGDYRRTRIYTIAQFTQPRIFPHIFLDGKQNGSNNAYTAKQRFQLEGDFNKYFDLYVPDTQRRDSLIILSPDVMQALVDAGRPYDIELVGNTVSVIASGTQYVRAKLPPLFRFMSTFNTELNDGTARWDSVDIRAALGTALKTRSMNDQAWIIFTMALVMFAIFTVLLFKTT